MGDDDGEEAYHTFDKRKSFIVDNRRKSRLTNTTQKVTEVDERVLINKIKQQNESEYYFDPYQEKKVQPMLVRLL